MIRLTYAPDHKLVLLTSGGSMFEGTHSSTALPNNLWQRSDESYISLLLCLLELAGNQR
jgi:hypothetical protein